MFDDLAAYFYENVLSAYKEYIDCKGSGTSGKSRDIRSAITAATALYHFREHLPQTKQLSWKQVVSQCPDYKLLGDVVNAAKHCSVTKYKPQIRDAKQIEEVIVITEYRDEQGFYRSIEKMVQLTLLDGSVKDMYDVLTNVMNFWQKYLQMKGIIVSLQYYDLITEYQHKSREECGYSTHNFEMVKGLRFKQNLKLQKYNYEKQRVEPIDLTGCEAKFQIYEPTYELNVTLINKITGKSITRSVFLTKEENDQLNILETEAEKRDYVSKLPSFQVAIQELATGEYEKC